jgi:hypothetical protein
VEVGLENLDLWYHPHQEDLEVEELVFHQDAVLMERPIQVVEQDQDYQMVELVAQE